jgi:hypothetical protein
MQSSFLFCLGRCEDSEIGVCVRVTCEKQHCTVIKDRTSAEESDTRKLLQEMAGAYCSLAMRCALLLIAPKSKQTQGTESESEEE